MRPPIDDGTIVITGASGGLGVEFARQLAPRARLLVLVARRIDRLTELRHELTGLYPRLEVAVEPADLASELEVDRLCADLSSRLGPVDVLINDAAAGEATLFDENDWRQIREALRVNVEALTLLARELVPQMVARRRGGILNVSGSTGLALLPGAAVYSASKHYVTALTEELAMELAGTGVVVTQSCPGAVDTRLWYQPGTRHLPGTPAWTEISAEQCVRESLAAFEAGRPIVYPGFANRQIERLQSFLPRPLKRVVGRRIGLRLRARRTLRERAGATESLPAPA